MKNCSGTGVNYQNLAKNVQTPGDNCRKTRDSDKTPGGNCRKTRNSEKHPGTIICFPFKSEKILKIKDTKTSRETKNERRMAKQAVEEKKNTRL